MFSWLPGEQIRVISSLMVSGIRFFETTAPELPLVGWPTLPEEVSIGLSPATPSIPDELTTVNQSEPERQTSDSLPTAIQREGSAQYSPATLLSFALIPAALLSLAVVGWTYRKRRGSF